jgi:hypothetical protein
MGTKYNPMYLEPTFSRTLNPKPPRSARVSWAWDLFSLNKLKNLLENAHQFPILKHHDNLQYANSSCCKYETEKVGHSYSIPRCAQYVTLKKCLTSKFATFSNPTHKTKTGTRWQTTNSKAPGPIIMIGLANQKQGVGGRSYLLHSSALHFTSLRSEQTVQKC